MSDPLNRITEDELLLQAELEHLREENRRLRLGLAEANDLCQHLRDNLDRSLGSGRVPDDSSEI
jgi:hypothetical protein